MNYTKLFRILAMAVILSLLVMAIPAAPALAAYDYDISLEPDEGEIGDTIDIDGDDWPPSDYGGVTPDIEEVDIYFTSYHADEGDDIDDEVENYKVLKHDIEIQDDGDFSTSFKVPDELDDGEDDEDVVRGTYYVCVTMANDKDIEAVIDFTVIAAEITLDTDNGLVGTEVEITGTDFDDRKEIAVEYDGDTVDIESGGDETDSRGEFEITILIPESAAGEHTIKVIDESDNEAEAVFAVEPEITISPESGMVEERVTVNGTGFAEREDVTIKFDSEEIATGSTGIEGSFAVGFDVPSAGPGLHEVDAEDDEGNSAETEFTVATNVSVSPVTSQTSPGYVGMDVIISGTGFKPSATVTITYTSTPVTFTTTSEADGSFSYTFKVPESEAGEHTITASDGFSTMEVTFIMESEAPEIPQPLLPLMDTKPERPIKFDWDDVEDLSGVTYTLQVAKDENFATIVLEKKELTKSEYPMAETEDEGLESTKKEEPYWWRVKAIDGASNESGWTGAGSFHIGFAFGLAPWAIYLLIGLGGLLLFFIGFLLGKRTVAY